MNNLAPQVFGAIIGAGATVLLGITALLISNIWSDSRQKKQHKHEVESTKIDFMKAKLEEIYFSFSKWDTQFSGVYISMIGYVKEELSESNALGLINNTRYEAGLHQTVDMLIHLYFPELVTHYKNIRDLRGEVVKFYPPRSKIRVGLSGFYDAQIKYENAATAFKNEMKVISDQL